MSDASTPQHRDADDARADDGPPTDAVSDEVKADSAVDAAPNHDAASASDTDDETADAASPAEPREGAAEPQVSEPTD